MRVSHGLGRGGDERGAISAFLALGIVVFLSMAALSIDLGMLMQRRTEAQRTADGAALAGAASLIYVPDGSQARDWAKAYADSNDVGTSNILLRDQDIDVILPDTVRVRVLRSQSYGGPVSTLFARLFGMNDVDVGTVAAAEAATGPSSVSCVLPVALPDRWYDTFYSPPEPVSIGTPEWEPLDGDYYIGPYQADGITPEAAYTGWQLYEPFVLLPSQGGSTPGPPPSTRLMPGMWELWLPPQNNGVPPIRERILGCPDGEDSAYVAGDSLYRESGNRQTLAETFRDIINLYPGQEYNSSCQCIIDTLNGNQVVTGGLRYRAMPVFDPNTYTQQGSGPHFEISHFVGVFIEDVDPGPPGAANIYGRIMPLLAIGGGSGSNAGPVVKYLRLVE
jgi:hypothetical protein